MAKTTLNFIWRYPVVALGAFFCLGLAAIASPTHGAESVNGIAAIVNDKVITYSEVRDVVEPRERLLRSHLRLPRSPSLHPSLLCRLVPRRPPSRRCHPTRSQPPRGSVWFRSR